MTRPRVLIPVALGTNRDGDLADAFTAAGADAERIPLAALRSGERRLSEFQILALPGGFSYGDALGAGRLLGLDLSGWFADQLLQARQDEMPILGVCNGFQALVRSGLLPGDGAAVLTDNRSGEFECRWVTLGPEPGNASVWLTNLNEPIRCPVAHGEGRFVAQDLDALERRGGIAFRYWANGDRAAQSYPANPNGSAGDVAGVTDTSGLVLGLMPHPENHIWERQDVLRGRQHGGEALPLFTSVVQAIGSWRPRGNVRAQKPPG